MKSITMKYFKLLSICILFSVPVDINADNINIKNKDINQTICQQLFIKYDIDPKIRSRKGWIRVYKSHTLLDFLNIKDNFTDSKINLANCLINDGFDIKKYQRSIGKIYK